MTLRTLTFNPKLYKLVPVAPIPKMLIAAGTVRGYDGAAPDEDHIAWWNRGQDDPPIKVGSEYSVGEALLAIIAAERGQA